MKNLFLAMTLFLSATSLFAVECNFQIGTTGYTIEINHASNALVTYGQAGGTGDGYPLSYTGTGVGGAEIYQSANAKLFVLNNNGMLSLKLMDLSLGEILFQDQQCRNSTAVNPAEISANVESALIKNAEIYGVVKIFESNRGFKCNLNKGMTHVESKQFRNEDDNTTEIVTQFSASITCFNMQYNAYAGRIDLSGSFDDNGNKLTLKQINLNQGAN